MRAGAKDAEGRIYPGFDPMGMSKGNLDELKLKEIKNGEQECRIDNISANIPHVIQSA